MDGGHPGYNAPLAPGARPAALAIRVKKESLYAAQKKAKGDDGVKPKQPEGPVKPVVRERMDDSRPPPLENDEQGKDEEDQDYGFVEQDAVMSASVVERDPNMEPVALFPAALSVKRAFPVARHRAEESKSLARTPEKEMAKHPILDAFLSQKSGEYDVNDIAKTNSKVLASMSEETILAERAELMSKLDPKLVAKLQQRGRDKATKAAAVGNAKPGAVPQPATAKIEEDRALKNLASAEALTLPSIEADKLAWMLKPAAAEPSNVPRFDFEGRIVQPGADIAQHAGLHHHGENPQSAGYSLKELLMLARSSVAAQRSIALKTLASIVSASDSPALHLLDVRHRLGRLNFAVLLRCSLDDTQVSVLQSSLDAILALLGDASAEESYKRTEAMHRGWEVQPTYSDAEELVDEELERAEISDAELAREDPLVGLLRMGLLLRLRYLLNAHKTVLPIRDRIRDLMIPLARHSAYAALHVLQCTGFLPLYLAVFLEGSEPDPLAVRALRALAQASRVVAEKIAYEGPVLALSRYILQPEKTPNDETLFRETMLLWRVCAEYGLNSSVFLDFFPALAQRLASLSPSLTASALIFSTAESLVHVSARAAGLTWPQPLSFLSPALATLAQMRNVTTLPPAGLALVAAAASYLASYFEHCTTQPGYTEPGNAQTARAHAIPLCLSPLLASVLSSLIATSRAVPIDLTQPHFLASCELVSAVARLCNRVRQVMPSYLELLHKTEGARFVEQLQRLCITLCNTLPLPNTREQLLSSEALLLRPPTRMLQYVLGLLAALPPPRDPMPLHHAAMSFVPRLLPGDETFFADILAGVVFNSAFAGKLALPLILEFFLLRYCPDRSFQRSLALMSSDVTSRPSLMLPVSQTVLPAPADWLLMPISQALEIVEKGEAIPPRHARAIRDLLPFVAAHPTGCLGGPGPSREECLLDVSKFFLLEGDLQNDAELSKILTRILQTYVGAGGATLHFDRDARGAFAVWLQLAEQYAAASFGDPVFSAYVFMMDDLFLSTSEPVEYRKALFLGQQHALTALAATQPPLPLAAYLDPPDTDEALLRAMINAVADERIMPPSTLYSIALHHVAAFLFRQDIKIDRWLRQEICKAVVRAWAKRVNALASLLDADANNGTARAERLKMVEESLTGEDDLRAVWDGVLVPRP